MYEGSRVMRRGVIMMMMLRLCKNKDDNAMVKREISINVEADEFREPLKADGASRNNIDETDDVLGGCWINRCSSPIRCNMNKCKIIDS
jgi:hypothetical protein